MKPLYEEQDVCVVCGLPCNPDEHDNDGNPIHEECRIDREAARIDAARDVWIGNYPERTWEEELERLRLEDEAGERKLEERRENGTDK
uniref:Uncharacterized protein n=1 Tax=viral metagenome TaxID=1070528 RepID=A0A6M3JD40_9ZZZZ